MAKIVHKRNGNIIKAPDGWQGLVVKKDFLTKKEDDSVNINQLIFSGEEAINIRERILNGLTGGVGIYEGDPYEIEIGEIGNPVFKFKGYLDYADSPEFIGENKVSVSLKKRQGNDWLNDVADGFSFRYLHEIGVISDSDFVEVPYVINYIPDGTQLILLSVSLYMMTNQVVDEVSEIAKTVGTIINASIPVIGVGAGVGAVAVTAWDIGDYIMAGIELTIRTAKLILLTVAIKKLIEEIRDQLMPPIRHHLGMSIYDLFEKACTHLDMEFESTLLTEKKDWVIIPSKGHKGGEKPDGWEGSWQESGVPEMNGPFDTFGDLIRVFSSAFNATYKITGNKFRFERIDFWHQHSNFVIGDFFTNQETLLDHHKPNTEEIVSNYFIKYNFDTQDQNTLNNQQGTLFQSILEPNIINNPDLVNLKHLQEIDIPCSVGLRKEKLTKVEEIFKELAQLVDTIVNTGYAGQIDSRVGSLLLSSDFLTIPKLVVMKGSKLAKNQRTLVGADKLWEDLHSINSFYNGSNQWNRFEGVKMPMCEKDFEELLECEFCKDSEGNDAMIEKLEWESYSNTAIMDYRIKKKHTNNLTLRNIKT